MIGTSRAYSWEGSLEGADAFFVDGKALSFGDKLSFQDMSGNELVYVEYTIARGDRVAATVSKRWFTWTDTYGIEIAVNAPVQLS